MCTRPGLDILGLSFFRSPWQLPQVGAKLYLCQQLYQAPHLQPQAWPHRPVLLQLDLVGVDIIIVQYVNRNINSVHIDRQTDRQTDRLAVDTLLSQYLEGGFQR